MRTVALIIGFIFCASTLIDAFQTIQKLDTLYKDPSNWTP